MKSMEKDIEKISGSKRIMAAMMVMTYVFALSPVTVFADSRNEIKVPEVKVEVTEEKSEVLISAENGGSVVLGRAKIEIPAGALKEDTVISITRLKQVSDTGESLYNATAESGGYRFLPAGTKFQKDVTITLPYNAELNSKLQSLDDLYTYFFDVEKQQWIKLERIEVDDKHCLVRSLSTHFTDMINATLTLPESASPVDVNLNSIKNLEAAKPDSHLIKFNPPKADNTGDASFSFDLAVPSGRHGMEPKVSVSFSSGGGNGIMGKGFDVSYGSSITTDTRKGLPDYDKENTYMLDGVLLKKADPDAKGDVIEYKAERESAFNRIIRFGAGTDTNYWEVTDKGGTKRIYGKESTACVGSGKETFTWNLTKVIDVYGNTIDYKYEKDSEYVYPDSIHYTGFNDKEGNYSVKFLYDEGNIRREDIRIDARSREIVSCKRLLTSITTHYNNLPAIRTYKFCYTEGLAKEKMLSKLIVVNNEDECYEYTFDYVQPERDDKNKVKYFAESKFWSGSSSINESSGKSSGGSTNASAGVGFGYCGFDARSTGGITGAVSSSTSYTNEQLIDIDGDGRSEKIIQQGNILLIYKRNQLSNAGFNEEPIRLDISQLTKTSFLMNKEESSTSSFGWNVYGGGGTPYGLASTGFIYSDVKQNGTTELYTGFYDMDGDGLVDIVTNTSEYLHNESKNNDIKFLPKKIENYPQTVTRGLENDEIEKFRQAYYIQRPFISWNALYEGEISVKNLSSKTSNFKVKSIYGDTEIRETESVSIKGGESLYFVPDVGNQPKLEELEKEYTIDVSIEYESAKLFGRSFELPVYFPDTSVYSCPSDLAGIYVSGQISNANGTSSNGYSLNNNYEQLLTSSERRYLLKNGLFVPGVLTEDSFVRLKEYLNKKANNLNETEENKKRFYIDFSTAYRYSVSDRLFHLVKAPDRKFFDNYIKGFVNESNIEEILSAYTQNNVIVDLSEGSVLYKSKSEAEYSNDLRYNGDNYTIGSSYVRDGNKYIYLGKFDGYKLIVDKDKKSLIVSSDYKEPVVVDDLSDSECVLNIGNGKYKVKYFLKKKTEFADTISNEEFELFASEYEKKYLNNTLKARLWEAGTDFSLEDIIDKLEECNVKEKSKQKDFIRYVFEEKTNVDDETQEPQITYSRKVNDGTEITNKEFQYAEQILKDAMYEKIREEDFPYYDQNNILKAEYRTGKVSIEDVEELKSLCSKYGIYKFDVIESEITYSPSGNYEITNGETEKIVHRKTDDTEIIYRKQKLEFADGKGIFNSTNDFSSENVIDEKKEMLSLYSIHKGGIEVENISVAVKEFLYGGKYNWFYGIWFGSEDEKEHKFTQTALNKLFTADDEEKNYEEYKGKTPVSDDEIENLREEKRAHIETEEKPKQSDFKYGCTLPLKDGNDLAGIESRYISETVYDDNGKLNVKSKLITSAPKLSAGKVRCVRLGGNAYYLIEGVPEATCTITYAIQKTQTYGNDVTSGPQVSILSFSDQTNTKNTGDGKMLQTLQDVNGDRIPDVLKIVNSKCQVYYGAVDADRNIYYPNTYNTFSIMTVLSSTYNSSSSKGFSFSPMGAIQSVYSAKGSQKAINLTNGFGNSYFNGENGNTVSLLDINGDGIADYINSGAVYLGKGNEYESEFICDWKDISKGSVAGTSDNINIGGGVPFVIAAPGKSNDNSSAGQNTSTSVSAGVGGCSSTSSSIQTQMLMDINGDGLVDMLRKAENQTASDFTEYEVYYNTGSKISSSSFETIYIPIWTEKVLGKYTIDNRAINSNNISYGDESVNLQNEVEIDLSAVSDKINNLDCSVTVSNNISGNLSVNVTIPIPVAWTGFSFNATVNVGGGLNSGSTNTSATVKMMDLDGDGLVDHVLNVSGAGIYWKQNISGTYGQLERVNLPQGGNIEIEYEPKYGTTDNPNFKYVMSKVTVNDGVDGKGNLPEVKHGEHSVVTSYKYDNGYYDRELKEFLGFGTVTTISSDTVQTDEYYNREYYSKGCIKNSTVKDLSKNILSVQETVLNEAPYALVKSETVKNYENGKYLTVNTEYEYDNFGNCEKLTQDFGDGKKLVADISYAEITDKYIMGLPYDITVTGSNGVLRHRWGKYDGNGQLEELHQYYNQTSYSVNTISYDGYGNIIKVSDSRGSTLEYKYDETHNMFLEEIKHYGTDTDVYKSKIEYDYALQFKKSETDCNGNSLTYKYDSWKRIEKIFTSYDKDGIPAVSYEYHTPDNSIKESAELWYAITNNKVAFESSEKNNPVPVIQTVLQIDGLGRAVRTSKTGCVNGDLGWNVSGVVEYDEKGRTIKEGMPEFVSGSLEDLLLTTPEMTELKTSYEYDVKDRQIKTILPDGSEQSVFYYVEGNRAIARCTDPNGNVSIQESDSRGNIVRVTREDKNGKQLTEVTYEYNEMGEMLKAYDSQKNAITVEYDMLGRRTALESNDLGRQEFFYDECSNLVRENNSVLREQNKQINYTYDNLNRLIYIDYPGTEEDTVYVYGKISDSNINAAGKILSVKDSSGTINYEYGQLGEVVKETRVLNTHLNGKNDTELAVMQYQSDYLGRMQWIIYPDGEKIIYGYDEGGQVTSVTGKHYNQTFPYVTKILYDQYGQRTRIEYGNGTATDYTYNPERRWLETVKTKNKYGQSYQNIRYDFDRVGNVKGYVNDCMDTLSGNYRTDQSYEYDDLYQLIHVTGNTEYYPAISSVPDYKSTYTQDFVFDDKGLGNMMSKVSKETVSPLKVIGDNLNYNIGYVYDENYAHRLVQAGNRYYKYDANGNIICEQDGSFDGSENDVSYYKVEQHSEDVYSTDNGWGLFKDESGEARGQARKYRRTYTWNSRNQLVSSVDANYSTSYVYGQDGQRSNKYTQGSETLYFNKMWTLHTDNGNSVYGGQYAKNVYLGETRIVTKLARADQKTAHEEMYKQYYYHSDHLGSASMISDWEGKEYQRIEYTPYGETWVEKTNNSGSEFLPYKFTGKEVDQETGLYYYGARYLDPKYSMWISTDPALGEYVPEMGKGNAKDSGTLPGMGGVYNHINGNLYAYAANNPVKYTDPDGRAILASNYAYNLFNNTKNEIKYITNSYNHPQFHLISNFAYYNHYGRFELLDSYDKEKEHYFKSKQEMNLERLGNSLFNFYKTITSEISKSDNGDIKYESKLMPEKYDNDGNQCYELSVTVKNKKSVLFYYSSIEARNQEQLKTLIGEFISLFNEGSKDDWKPNKNISIDGETPYN